MTDYTIAITQSSLLLAASIFFKSYNKKFNALYDTISICLYNSKINYLSNKIKIKIKKPD